MRILIACENSLIVASAFAQKGHEVIAVDLQPKSSTRGFIPHPRVEFYQEDIGSFLHSNWDLIVAFPPCTFLTSAAAWRWPDTQEQILQSLDFIVKIWNAPAKRIGIENPTGWLNNHWRQPDQILSPHMFGSRFRKRTCLWLKNLPPLIYTCQILNPRSKVSQYGSNHNKAKLRSKFTPELAAAMANQWNF